MSEDNKRNSGNHLRAGQFYGEVFKKQDLAGLVMSELKHTEWRKLPKHSHELAFFNLLLRGDYSEQHKRDTIIFKPLTASWHPPQTTHLDEVGHSGVHFFTVEIQPRWVDRLREYSNVPQTQFDLHGGELSWLALRLYREFKEEQNCSQLAIEGLMLEMLAVTTRHNQTEEKQQPVWLSKVIDLLHAEFQQKLSMEEIANEAGVHPVHLAKVFRQFNRVTISEYQHQLRVQFACKLLTELDTNLAEIALSAGFSDQSHFTRIFHRTTGMTPNAFRKMSMPSSIPNIIGQ